MVAFGGVLGGLHALKDLVPATEAHSARSP
jgi:hypothetical protein